MECRNEWQGLGSLPSIATHSILWISMGRIAMPLKRIMWELIIESVNSILCRDTTYMPIPKKSLQISETVHLEAFITTCRSSFECFSWPTRLLASRKVPHQVLAKWANCFSSSFFFRRASSMSPQSLMMVYARNSSILHRAVHQPIIFLQLRSLTPCRRLQLHTKNLWLRHFNHLYACAHKRSLSNDT